MTVPQFGIENSQNKSASMMAPSEYTGFVLSSCVQLQKSINSSQGLILNGRSLSLSDMVAISKHGSSFMITDDAEILDKMVASVELLNQRLAEDKVVYGVNTGVGGNADTRTKTYNLLQKALIQHHNTAVLLPSHQARPSSFILDSLPQHYVPIPIVKAAMLARCNSLIRGHSAVRVDLVRNLATLINQNFTPVVPLRGSISASGDLTPLSYIAGALEGNPDIFIHGGKQRNNSIISADKALQQAGLQPLSFGPKEALGLLNGTAFSTGAASLVLFEANQLVLLSQIVTAMCTEALLGTRRNFHPFISDVRPHPGQKNVAENMYRFLADSKLATNQHAETIGLAQDRYSLRTAAQWIGPQVENMALASQQVQWELNSTTDNPLFDIAEQTVHHGGNFQASSITTAMEKTTSSMQMIGKILFSQCSEILNPMLSKGLTPNLCVDDPSLSYALKGVDINMASYMSELSYLNNPVSNFVQTADVNNQPVNSLALIAARYAGDAVEILSLMVASYIYVLCQALDLRALHVEFEKSVRPRMAEITTRVFTNFIASHKSCISMSSLQDSLWKEIMGHWSQNTTRDLSDRAETSIRLTLGTLLELLDSGAHNGTCEGSSKPEEDGADIPNLTSTIYKWQASMKTLLVEQYELTRKAFLQQQTTKKYLSSASARVYSLVRDQLDVPMHKGLVDHPTYVAGTDGDPAGAGAGAGKEKRTIGSHITTIYSVLREGGFMETLVDCWGYEDMLLLQKSNNGVKTGKKRPRTDSVEGSTTSQAGTEEELASTKNTKKHRKDRKRR